MGNPDYSSYTTGGKKSGLCHKSGLLEFFPPRGCPHLRRWCGVGWGRALWEIRWGGRRSPPCRDPWLVLLGTKDSCWFPAYSKREADIAWCAYVTRLGWCGVGGRLANYAARPRWFRNRAVRGGYFVRGEVTRGRGGGCFSGPYSGWRVGRGGAVGPLPGCFRRNKLARTLGGIEDDHEPAPHPPLCRFRTPPSPKSTQNHPTRPPRLPPTINQPNPPPPPLWSSQTTWLVRGYTLASRSVKRAPFVHPTLPSETSSLALSRTCFQPPVFEPLHPNNHPRAPPPRARAHPLSCHHLW